MCSNNEECEFWVDVPACQTEPEYWITATPTTTQYDLNVRINQEIAPIAESEDAFDNFYLSDDTDCSYFDFSCSYKDYPRTSTPIPKDKYSVTFDEDDDATYGYFIWKEHLEDSFNFIKIRGSKLDNSHFVSGHINMSKEMQQPSCSNAEKNLSYLNKCFKNILRGSKSIKNLEPEPNITNIDQDINHSVNNKSNKNIFVFTG